MGGSGKEVRNVRGHGRSAGFFLEAFAALPGQPQWGVAVKSSIKDSVCVVSLMTCKRRATQWCDDMGKSAITSGGLSDGRERNMENFAQKKMEKGGRNKQRLPGAATGRR